ncbi:MAG: hypothetical protein QX189_04695 [Methylococcales bacterium]
MNALIKQFLLDQQLSTHDLRDYCNLVGSEISLIWGIDDVHQANKNLNYRVLSDQEALLILANVERAHDATQGISWETIAWHISNYLETERGL